MAYIETGNRYPGILGLLWFKVSTGSALSLLAETVLRGPSGLAPGERELIAAYVSRLNDCEFCTDAHSASAGCHLADQHIVAAVLANPEHANVSPKMRALFRIVGKVQKGGKHVQPTDVAEAKGAGASDEDIHDAVLVAAAFCMYNRYVDGLGTLVASKTDYPEMGQRLAKQGYKLPSAPLRWLVRRILDKKFAPPPSSANTA